MRKIIKIFLASSLVELKAERLELENFIRNVSDRCEEKYDVKIQPLLCENFDPAMANGRKQEEYNALIRGCDVCFFIFFTKAGAYTVEEFKVAYEQFSQTKKPTIYTYFKELDAQTAEQSLLDFMDMLDKTLGHYYNSFSHLDTLKCRVLQYIFLSEMDFVCIDTKENTCFVDGEAMLCLDNVAEFQNNKPLQNILTELEQAERQCAALKDSDDTAAYASAYNKCRQLRQKAEELRKSIFDFSLGILRDTVHGTVTKRQLQAFQYLEKGDLQSALNTLSLADMKNDFLQEQKMIEDAHRTSVVNFLREIKTRIRLLAIAYENTNRFAEMEEAFLAAVPLALQEKTELDILAAYMDFLQLVKHDCHTAADVGEQLCAIYETVNTDDRTRFVLYEKLESVYGDMPDAENQKRYRSRAIQVLETLCEKDRLCYGAVLAEKYCAVAIDYKERKNAKQAKQYFEKAETLLEELVKCEPLKFADELVNLYNELALFFMERHAFAKSEKTFINAVQLYESLHIEEPHTIHETILAVLYNLTNLYHRHHRRKKERACLSKRIALLERLESGALVALFKEWHMDNDTFKNTASVAGDSPLKIVPDLLPEQQEPIPCGEQANKLVDAYIQYGFLTKEVRTYLQKAYAVAARHPENEACREAASELRPWA
ncbi:MAG: tetratricopeptide repeat protein [Clostridia bacterium]|nr:tetratricopeptide repeat protein [Clostridia bacterium]